MEYDRFVVTFENGSASGSAVDAAAADANAVDVISDDVQSKIESSAKAAGANLVSGTVHADETATFTLSEKLTTDEAKAFIESVQAEGQVAHVEPDFVMHAMTAPNDPNYGQQWSLAASAAGIGVEGAWQHATGRGVNVAVIDSGINANHPDLASKLHAGYDFMSDPRMSRDGDGRDANPQDEGDWMRAGDCGANNPRQDQPSSWHGSHVSGIIGAATGNGEGMAGVARDAQIVPVRALGWCGGMSSDIADAITWATGGTVPGVPANPNPATVVNMSLGGSAPSCPRVYQNAIDAATQRGAVIVVAAGNESQDVSRVTPANCRNVIVVGATGPKAGQSYFSNFGNGVTVSAPGGDARAGGVIQSTVDRGQTKPAGPTYGGMQGTSQAAPHVAGVVAMLKQLKPNMNVAEASRYLTAHATPLSSCRGGCGAGIIDAAASVAAAAGSNGGAVENPAAPNTPAPSAPAATTAPSAPSAPTTSEPSVTLSNTALRSGERVTVTASGYQPGERITFVVDSWNYRLSTLQADRTGTIRATWTVDRGLGSGSHVFFAVGHNTRAVAGTWFSIR